MPDPTVSRGRVVEAVPMSGVAVEQVEYLGVHLADGRVPLGMITLLGGDPGLGKSLLTCHLAAEVSRGGGAVLLASAEDSYGAVVRPRWRYRAQTLTWCTTCGYGWKQTTWTAT